MNEYPNWIKGITPMTEERARVTKKRFAKNVKAVKVSGGEYRKAILNDIFEVADMNPRRKNRIVVKCSWFGVTPPNIYPQLDISNGRFQYLENYTGEVVDNISI